MAVQRHEISLRVLENISQVSHFLSNRFMMNLKLQNAAQRHSVFVECYVVKLLSSLRDRSRKFSTFLDYS